MAALKAPLIVLASLLLCLPSLFVFLALGGAPLPLRRLPELAAGFTATLGVLLLALVPVAWLFSVSSRFLGFVVASHLALWLAAVLSGRRYLRRPLGPAAHRPLGLWLLLFLLVSLQMTTHLRPVLAWVPGKSLFSGRRLFFIEHFGEACEYRIPPTARQTSTESGAAESP